jgi:hypothetical protein
MIRIVAFLLMFPALAAAQVPARDAAQAVISAQIAAFESSDLATAYGYASPFIQHMFPSPERFGAMVEQGYPMIWRPATFRYLDARLTEGALVQRVMFTDAQGRLFLFDYDMIETPQGVRINGVRPVRGGEAGA